MVFKSVLAVTFILCFGSIHAQEKGGSDFWNDVQFGGGIGVSVGSDFTDISLAPSAIYNFNEYFAAGVGLQGSFVKVRTREPYYDGYKSYIYGGSLIGLFTPIEGMPEWAQYLNYLNPMSFFMDIIKLIILKGCNIHDIQNQMIVLSVMAVIINTAAIASYREKVN